MSEADREIPGMWRTPEAVLPVTQVIDAELMTMASCWAAIETFDEKGRTRILAYLNSKNVEGRDE